MLKKLKINKKYPRLQWMFLTNGDLKAESAYENFYWLVHFAMYGKWKIEAHKDLMLERYKSLEFKNISSVKKFCQEENDEILKCGDMLG